MFATNILFALLLVIPALAMPNVKRQVTVVPTTTFSSPVSGPTGTTSCEALLLQCRNTNPSPNFSDILYELPCVAAATCNPAKLDGIIARLSPTASRAAVQPRLSKTMFDFYSTDKAVWTEQNYIDFYYTALTKKDAQGPFPASVTEVQAQWSVIAGWTGFCGNKAVPYGNLADYFQYASTNAAGNPCDMPTITTTTPPPDMTTIGF